MRGEDQEQDHHHQHQGECSQTIENMFQEQLLLHQQLQNNTTDHIIYGDHHHHGAGRGLIFPADVVSPVLNSWPPLNPFLIPPPPPPPPPTSLCSSSSYGNLFNRRPANCLQFAYDGTSSADHLGRIISTTLGPVVHHGSTAPFGLQAELGKMSAQEIMDAKALAASKSHSEAERRRRERINNHLAKLRSLLPSTTKTDKASLLAEVIQHVKELKRQTSLIAETSPIPTDIDELTVDDASDEMMINGAKFVIKASLCCEDRSDLLPDLIKTLKSLRLRTLKAEITTLGGRVRNVLFVTGEDDEPSTDHNNNDNNNNNNNPNSDSQQQQQQHSISSIQEALKAVMEKTGPDDSSSGNIKRQRTNNINIL
ncbi:transcription factor bHLH30-like [Cucurbita moschata]|uniref:Transcription factor bHLH30-like n=1 Tax=Cucurbita moschata TaxID=3662 RepID=A0A6J1G0W5_CUCMO|nr:transcription factor bHLH30-like [Cucurbita moschata]